MLEPVLEAGVEKRHCLAGFGIGAGRSVALVTVANRATQPQVSFLVAAAFRDGDDVFDFQPGHDQVLRAEAITATILGRRAHAAIYFDREVGPRHVRSAADAGRGPRPRS